MWSKASEVVGKCCDLNTTHTPHTNQTYLRIYACTHARVQPYMHTCKCGFIHTCMHAHVHARIHAQIFTHPCASTCICSYVRNHTNALGERNLYLRRKRHQWMPPSKTLPPPAHTRPVSHRRIESSATPSTNHPASSCNTSTPTPIPRADARSCRMRRFRAYRQGQQTTSTYLASGYLGTPQLVPLVPRAAAQNTSAAHLQILLRRAHTCRGRRITVSALCHNFRPSTHHENSQGARRTKPKTKPQTRPKTKQARNRHENKHETVMYGCTNVCVCTYGMTRALLRLPKGTNGG